LSGERGADQLLHRTHFIKSLIGGNATRLSLQRVDRVQRKNIGPDHD